MSGAPRRWVGTPQNENPVHRRVFDRMNRIDRMIGLSQRWFGTAQNEKPVNPVNPVKIGVRVGR